MGINTNFNIINILKRYYGYSNKKIIIYQENKKNFLIVKKNNIPIEIIYVEEEKKLDFIEIKIIISIFNDINKKHNNIIKYYKIISKKGYKYDKKMKELENHNISLEDSDYITNIKKYNNNDNDYIELMPHNKYTYDKIKTLFKNYNKVCAIQATGTGKSYLAAKCALDCKDDNKIIISSSHSILDQFKKNFKFLRKNTIFMHYAKLNNLNDEELLKLKKFDPKLIILDEFHRGGANEWEKGVRNILNLFPSSKVLGTSATPIRYLDNNRDMSNEIFDGVIANTINLFDAFVKNILPIPRYVQAFFEIENDLNNTIKKIDSSRNSDIEKAYLNEMLDVLITDHSDKFDASKILKKYISTERKFIIFCKDINHMNELKEIVKGWFEKSFSKININIYTVNSKYSNSTNELNRFINNKDNSFDLLFSVDKLNEGVHVSNIDGVILLRPTISPTIYFQQLGRCLQSNKMKKPIIFDFVNNSDNIQVINLKEGLKNAFESNNNRLEHLGLYKKEDSCLEEMLVNIHDETKDILSILKDINLGLSNDWESMFYKLQEYYYENGESLENINIKEKTLLTWVRNQRALYKTGKLAKDRINKLDQIGFIWEVLEDKWIREYSKLLDFYNKNNNSDVPRTYIDKKLYDWTLKQKSLKRKGSLSKEKIEMLDKLNFIWEKNDKQWNEQFEKLKKFYYENGKNAICKESEDIKLSKWIRTQRGNYKKNKLSQDKIDKLESIGFVWDALREKWMGEYNKLKEIYIKNLNSNISISHEDNRLYSWVIQQRLMYKKGKLSKERIELLNEIEFNWNE